MSKTVPFQIIQFSIITQFSSIWPIDRTLSGATTPGQSGPGSDGNEGVLHIPHSSRLTGAPPSDCLGHSLGESYSSAEKQSVYFTAQCQGAEYSIYAWGNPNNAYKLGNPFQLLQYWGVGKRAIPFPGLLHLPLISTL